MTAVSPMVLLLIAVALLVGVLTILAAVGRLDASMDPPHDPWWEAARRRRESRGGARRGRRRRHRADSNGEDEDARASV